MTKEDVLPIIKSKAGGTGSSEEKRVVIHSIVEYSKRVDSLLLEECPEDLVETLKANLRDNIKSSKRYNADEIHGIYYELGRVFKSWDDASNQSIIVYDRKKPTTEGKECRATILKIVERYTKCVDKAVTAKKKLINKNICEVPDGEKNRPIGVRSSLCPLWTQSNGRKSLEGSRNAG